MSSASGLILVRTCLASSSLPLLRSHLGDSGMKMKPTNWRAAGSPARPSIHLQPWEV